MIFGRSLFQTKVIETFGQLERCTFEPQIENTHDTLNVETTKQATKGSLKMRSHKAPSGKNSGDMLNSQPQMRSMEDVSHMTIFPAAIPMANAF